MSIKQYQIINVQAYKHRGTLYRQWNGLVVFDVQPKCVILIMPQTKVIEKNGQHWRVKEPTLWYFPTGNNFYNATALIRKKGYYIYTNLASPFIFEDNTLKFIDYDLYIKYYPGISTHVVDIEEHKKNSLKYKYEDSVLKKINQTKEQLLKMIENEEFIYSKDFTKQYFKKLVSDNQYKKTLTL